MSWWKTGERRQIVDWPEGRDWRCPNPLVLGDGTTCGFSEPEDARPLAVTCPRCGTRLVRCRVRL